MLKIPLSPALIPIHTLVHQENLIPLTPESIYLAHRPAPCALTHLCSGTVSVSSASMSQEESDSCLPALKQKWLQNPFHTAAISNELL